MWSSCPAFTGRPAKQSVELRGTPLFPGYQMKQGLVNVSTREKRLNVERRSGYLHIMVLK